MPDAEDAIRQLAQARAEREIEALQGDLPDAVGVGRKDRRQGGGKLALVGAEQLQAPGADRAAGGLGVPCVAGEDGVQPLLEEHGERFAQAIEEIRGRGIGIVSRLIRLEDRLPIPIGAA